jgi:hypothetical protein
MEKAKKYNGAKLPDIIDGIFIASCFPFELIYLLSI